MKIVVIGPIYPWRGGISHSNTILCSNISKNHDVFIISFKYLYPKFLFPGKKQKYEERKKINLSVDSLINSLNPISWIRAFQKIKKIDPDLVIFQWWTIFLTPFSFSLLFLIKFFSKVKINIFCQNVLPHEKGLLNRLLTKMVFVFADYFIVMSSSDMKDLKKLIPNAKAKVLIEPTYDHFFGEKNISKKKARQKLGISGKIILFFGFVRNYKGLKYLLEAMPLVLEKMNVKLLVIGEFWENKEKYMSQIKKLRIQKQVIIEDRYVPDAEAADYFSCADVVVLPYESATQSAILQMAYGFSKPVITTNVGSMHDLVDHEITGLIVPPKNSIKLAQAILQFYSQNMENKLIQNINKNKKKFDWDQEKEKILFHGL